MDKTIFIDNFNLCPLLQSPTLGHVCLECEYMSKIEEEFFCIFEDEENPDELLVKNVINKLLDLLEAGHTTFNRDEIIKMIKDM